MLIRHLNKYSQKSTKSSRKSNRKSNRKHKGGGTGYIAQVEGARIGGLSEIMGYSQCCPLLYQGGKVAYTGQGNRMCGGRRKLKKTKSRKLKKSKSRRLRKSHKSRNNRK